MTKIHLLHLLSIYLFEQKKQEIDQQWLECVARKRQITKQISRELTKQAKLCEEKQKQRKKITKLTTSLRNTKKNMQKWELKSANSEQT